MAVISPQASSASGEDAIRDRAAEIHDAAIVIDGHNDVALWILDFGFDLGMDGNEPRDRWAWHYLFLPWLPGRPAAERLRTHTDLSRMKQGGLDAQFFSVWVGPEYYDPVDPVPGRAKARAHTIIDALEDQITAPSSRIEFALTAEDVRRIVAGGKLAALLGLEGGHAIEDDLATLEHYYRRGVRYMTLTWSFSHTWADAAEAPLEDAKPRHGGLTDFGKRVVRRMNDLGMLVDISHVSDATFWDALEVTRAPVIASHSSTRAIADHPRNMSDEMLRAVAANGGVVMINFFIQYLDPRKITIWKMLADWVVHFGGSETSVANVADHIDHVVQVAGIDHVGLGSDFDGAPFLPSGLRDVGDFPNITLELVRRGYTEGKIRKILGENVLRVLSRAEELAASVARRSEHRSRAGGSQGRPPDPVRASLFGTVSSQVLWLLLPLLWAVLCVGIAHLTGWARLSESYRSSGDFNGRIWRFQSASLRWGTGYNATLNVGVNDFGLFLSVFPLFRIAHPPLLVPWEDISTSVGRRMGIQYTELRFRRAQSVSLSIRRRLADRVAAELGERWSSLARAQGLSSLWPGARRRTR